MAMPECFTLYWRLMVISTEVSASATTEFASGPA
jgi:hypothetical protein